VNPAHPITGTLTTHSAQATIALGQTLAQHVRAGDILALHGELGAGKTQFVRGLAEGMAVTTAGLASPTFVMMHEYLPDADHPAAPVLIHLDAYRLKNLDDLESIGGSVLWNEDYAGGAVVAIEWADRIAAHLGPDMLAIHFTHTGATEREIALTGHGQWTGRMPALLAALGAIPDAELPSAAAESSHTCPICKATVRKGNDYEPFCSQRCKMVDLGRWLGGHYVISRPVEQRDLEEGVD